MVSLVLVGGGHSHLFALEAFARHPQARVRLRVVSPTALSTYSGMMPGVLGGAYALREAQIDLARLARRAAAELILSTVVALDPATRHLSLADGRHLPYDLASFDIGSLSAPLARATDAPLIAMKPFAEAAAHLERALAAPRPRVVIGGGGAAGVELAWAIATRLRDRLGSSVTVCDRAASPLATRGAATQRRALHALRAAGIAWRGGVEITAVEGDAVRLADGGAIPATLVINASGAAGAALFAAAGLPVDGRGFLRVGDDLRCAPHPELFASGDCAVLDSYPRLPRAGVYAVRQGPLLAHNLRAAIDGRPLRRFRPRRNVLALLNTADGAAILSYGRIAYHGRAAWWLKNAIDRRFVARFG